MRLPKFIRWMFACTIFALIYIHMQMQIFALAYQVKSKEKEIIELSETNGMITYDILRLKSANNLGGKLLNEESKLRFRDQESVVRLVAAESMTSAKNAVPVEVQQKKTNALLSLFSLKPAPEAQADERLDEVKPWRRSR